MAEKDVNVTEKAENTILFVGGKHSAMAIGEAVGGGVAAGGGVATSNGALTAAAATSGLSAMAMVTTMGLGAAVSAALTQIEYNHKRKHLKNLYCEELASKCHKPLEALSDKDLDLFAKGDQAKGIATNHTLAEQLDKTKRQRNWGIAFSVAATLASLAVVMSIVSVPTAISGALGEGLADFVVKGAAGVLTYNIIKQPLHYLGDKLFGLDKETTHDRIVAMKDDRETGKHITREQVLAVFASAKPKLDTLIVTDYGKHFDELPVTDRQKVADELSKILPLDRLAADINLGKINATELAFAVEGQESGVAHQPTPAPQRKTGVISTLVAKVRHAMHRDTQATIQVMEPESKTQEVAATAMAYAETAPTGSFVQRLGLSQINQNMSQSQRLDQRALAEAAERTGPH